jgi:hypothetical protein
MKKSTPPLPPCSRLLLAALLLFSLFLTSFSPSPNWGFFAHRRINRLAVLTLPPGMMVFFKPNIDWIADHAVDADMRRYSTPYEAPRHYIDLDQYGKPPYDSLPRGWLDAMAQYTDIRAVRLPGDTVVLLRSGQAVSEHLQPDYRAFVSRQVLPAFYRGKNDLHPDSLPSWMMGLGGHSFRPQAVVFDEHLSEHGILPWHLQKMQRDLTEAFRRRDERRILRLSADIGHYIGDAHVPLHTTSNYNGQKTGQHGIHGFWESRIPELFADESYDYLVGKPVYIERTAEFFWGCVLESNGMVDSVLTLERQLRETFPADRQTCPDRRNGIAIVAPCREFSAAYQDLLNNMIERRMRAAIHAVSSAWYTAWVDAGQPDLSDLSQPIATEAERLEEEQIRKDFERQKALGRAEEH